MNITYCQEIRLATLHLWMADERWLNNITMLQANVMLANIAV